jgi:hypothetical protein
MNRSIIKAGYGLDRYDFVWPTSLYESISNRWRSDECLVLFCATRTTITYCSELSAFWFGRLRFMVLLYMGASGCKGKIREMKTGMMLKRNKRAAYLEVPSQVSGGRH